MIDALLNKLSKELFFSDNGKKGLHDYEALTQHDGWKTHQSLLIGIMNNISAYMLSNDFTKLDRDEKDIQQRAFYIVKETATFLLDPLANARKYAAIKAVNQKTAKGLRKHKPNQRP